MPRKVSSSRPKSPELAPIARRIHSRVLHHRSQAPASGLCLEARAANQPDAQPIAHARTRLDGSFRIEFTGAYLEEWLGGQRSISLRVLAGTTEIETTTELICDLDSDVLDLTIEVEVERHDLPLPPHPTPPTPVPQPPSHLVGATTVAIAGQLRDQSQPEPLGGYRVTVAIWHARSSAVTSATDLTSAQGVFTMSLPVPSVDVAAIVDPTGATALQETFAMSAVKGQVLDLRVLAQSRISTLAQLDSAGRLAPLLDNYQ